MKMINCICYISFKKFYEFHGCVRQWMMCILNALIVKKYIKYLYLQRYDFVLWSHVYMLSCVAICLWDSLFTHSYPPIQPKVIYTHIGIFVACGFLLSFRYKCKEVSLVYCGQMLYLVYTLFTNTQMDYTQWQKVRGLVYIWRTDDIIINKLKII